MGRPGLFSPGPSPTPPFAFPSPFPLPGPGFGLPLPFSEFWRVEAAAKDALVSGAAFEMAATTELAAAGLNLETVSTVIIAARERSAAVGPEVLAPECSLTHVQVVFSFHPQSPRTPRGRQRRGPFQ
jgi:hypothetical protein